VSKLLIYGYGNPGRQDDGLGIMLVEKLEQWAESHGIHHIDFEYNYQLNIEDALTISEYSYVLFADASVEDIEDIKLAKVIPTEKTEFTMHAMLPGFILHLCQSLYSKFPETFILSIKGYEFELKEGITKQASKNLDKAFDVLIKHIVVPDFSKVADGLENILTDKTPKK